jgi:hypothetical protein
MTWFQETNFPPCEISFKIKNERRGPTTIDLNYIVLGYILRRWVEMHGLIWLCLENTSFLACFCLAWSPAKRRIIDNVLFGHITVRTAF